MDPISQQLMMGAAGAGSAEKIYVEDVFSTWLYTGNGSTQTITNGIDLSGKGGLVWIKQRSVAQDHLLVDTARGASNSLVSNSTAAGNTLGNGIGSNGTFNSNGFTLANGTSVYGNQSGYTYASWTFRKAAKFFDVVTYTGAGGTQTVNHSLGSTPGCIIIKRTDTTSDWLVYHRGVDANPQLYYLKLNSPAARDSASEPFNAPSSTNFVVKNSASTNGATYVAYLFAHDAGGFGASGNDSVVSCGSYTGNGSTSGPTVNLGWEPQLVLTKPSSSTGAWTIHDDMRGFAVTGGAALQPHLSNAEYSSSVIRPTSTGFELYNTSSDFNGSGVTYIYIAIRRGPMKTPTDATKVFATQSTQAAPPLAFTSNFPVDLMLRASRGIDTYRVEVQPRLTGTNYLVSNVTNAEFTGANINFASNSGMAGGSGADTTRCAWMFRRAPGFFDVVAYTGTGANRTVSHNLGVAPELMIVKRRSTAEDWAVYTAATGNQNRLLLNLTTESSASFNTWNNTSPTSSVFSVGTSVIVNGSGSTYIAYLFASCPGVSKVGSYTGTGTTLNIDCGFTAGTRFVLIKRTDSTGNWYVWDTARGIVSGNDPYLLLNLTDSEYTNNDYIDPLNSGFQISSTAPAAINANGGSYIYLSVA